MGTPHQRRRSVHDKNEHFLMVTPPVSEEKVSVAKNKHILKGPPAPVSEEKVYVTKMSTFSLEPPMTVTKKCL